MNVRAKLWVWYTKTKIDFYLYVDEFKVKKIVLEALIGFVMWTSILTPYVLLVTNMTMPQYLSWLVMQAVIVPPVAVVVVRATNWLTKRLSK